MAQRVADHTIKPEDLDKLEKKQKKQSKKGASKELESWDKPVSDQKTEAGSKAKIEGESDEKDRGKKETEKSPAKKKAGKQKKKRGVKYLKARKSIDKAKSYKVLEALDILKKSAFAKFTETVELHVTLGIDPKNSDQRVRFTTSLPFSTGKIIQILVLSDNNEGKKDNVLYRDISAVDEILNGKLKPETDFNIIVATPASMKGIAKAAKILGPKGMMPSPKTGTITDNPEKVLKDLSKGQIEVKNQPNHAVIHQIIGKINFNKEDLEANINHLLEEIQKNSPAKMKKKLILKAYIATTMSPSIRLDI